MSRAGKKSGLSAQARQSLRERRRAARKKDKLMSPQERLRALIAAGGNFIVPEGIGLRELLADQSEKYPPDMTYGDLVRAFAKHSAAQPNNQDYSTWDVLESYPYRYPSKWDEYPPTTEEIRALAQKERLRYSEMIPVEWSDCEPRDDEPEDVRVRMHALSELAWNRDQPQPLEVGERREDLVRLMEQPP